MHAPQLEHTFDEPGKAIVGCHQLGHYEDGVRLTVEVVQFGCAVPPSTAA